MEIAAVSVAGAGMAMLHETTTQDGQARMASLRTVPVPAGGEAEFAPGGLHVMVMDLGEDLDAGGETEVTVTFANGDKASFPAAIVGPGGSAPIEVSSAMHGSPSDASTPSAND